MLDTQKLAKEAAAQAEEQAVTKAAMEISKRAEKVATSGKAVESSEYTPSDEGMEADSGELNVPTETEEESDEEDLPEK
ncbi:hypothetical protein, conserved [Eimeria tenella]|uniref:Uncharacterized protein n=1 Tax=Eimeria tenella TaxID=5802 RepID=U6KY06_EIMTE|nr:hypothetical protein, conserved [Eimeria tenella]CDJ43027.1 hypothetical protein, conserved [Eimeria tenella]|eukprot:XP_013233777.1 hypothetical protein, conserved [Eimeria tenella]